MTHRIEPPRARRIRLRRIVLAGLAVLAAVAGPASAQGADAPAPAAVTAPSLDAPALVSPLTDDPRSTILLRYDCQSDAGGREVTLFADGTVRLRKVTPDAESDRTEGISTEEAGTGKEVMRLYELDPDSLQAYRNRLADEDLSEVEVESDPVEGEWVETCALDLLENPPTPGHTRPAEEPPPEALHYRFSGSSALPLALSRVIHIAKDLIADVEKAPGQGGLPQDYQPRPGDVLERSDGVLFKIVDFTVDEKGLELSGVEDPLVIYIAPNDLRKEFVRVVSRADGESPPQ